MTMEIRKAVVEDLEVLMDISRRTIDACHRFLGDEAVDRFINGPSNEYVDENLTQTEVIINDGQVVGYCVCKDNLIDLMMIDHNLHRRGYGTTLLEHCEQVLFKTHDELILESFEDNEQASSFYRKNSWFEAKRFLDSDGTGFRKILFRKMKSA